MESNNYDKTCIYDGITFFIKDQSSINYILQNASRYNIEETTDLASQSVLWKYRGRYKNFTIKAHFNSKVRGLTVGGSLHKYKNVNQNHDHFKWSDFLSVYNEIINEFRFNPKLVDIWSLEGGVNIRLPENYRYKASDIPKMTILLKGEARKASRNKYAKDGYGLEISKGECKYKMYDKGSQFKLEYEVLRNECSCKSRPLKKLGLRSFQDLINVDSHSKYSTYLLRSFETLLIFQPEILEHSELRESDRMFLYRFNTDASWNNVRKISNYQYQKNRLRLDQLINRYCAKNYRQEILNQMKSQLN